MKLKYYLRGLGIGILVTTIIFMIGIHVNREELFSDEEVIARAKSLGMVMEENETKTLDEVEEQKKSEEEQKDTKEEKQQQEEEKQEDEKSAEQKTDASEEKTSETDPQQTADSQAQPQNVKQIEINILPGEYSDTISQKLLDAGLIADITDFNHFITDHDYDNLIQPGTFTIPEGSSYEEIATILTTKQENR